MTLAFHAAAPDGEWTNDPNALVHVDGAYRLFVQHQSDAPASQATGWARYSSTDLLHWTFDGPVIPAAEQAWAYSGSVLASTGGLEAFHTIHDSGSGLQRQVRRTSDDAGLTWRPAPLETLDGEPARNARDPYVFQQGSGSGWSMLLAHPCDWNAGPDDPPSELVILRSEGRVSWWKVGGIGPWSPRGVLWEVPVLVQMGEHAVLFVSLVDRRSGGADCSVRAWVGTFDGETFVRSHEWPDAGELVDLGPDFYAVMASAAGGWPRPKPVFVAWLSSWETARRMDWPGFAGGPTTLPREISLERIEGRLRLLHKPAAGLVAAFDTPLPSAPVAGLAEAWFDGSASFTLSITSPTVTATISGDPGSGRLSVARDGADWLRWERTHSGVLAKAARRGLYIFIDGPCVEIFAEPDGRSLSLALPQGGEPLVATLDVGGAAFPLTWKAMASSLTALSGEMHRPVRGAV